MDEDTAYVCGDGRGAGVVVAFDSANGAERWSVPVWAPDDDPYPAGMVSVGGVLVIGTGTAVVALEARTGRRMWEAPSSSVDTIAGADGVVVAAAYDGFMALDAMSGGQVWAGPDGTVGSWTLVVHNGVCFSAEAHRVDARDLRTGRVLWSHDTGSPEHPSLTAAGEVVAVGVSDSVEVLDAATGRPRWSAPLALLTDYEGDLSAVGDVLVARVKNEGEREVVRALDLATGAPRWTLPEYDGIGLQAVLAADGIVYVKPWGSPTSAYDAASGKPRWVYRDSGIWEPVAARGPDAYLFETLGKRRIQAVRSP